MEVQFKVYARVPGGKPEVRRFGVDRTIVTSYHYLVAKLEEVFPVLKGQKYTVAWKDEEGDEITISSDEEMLLALQNMGWELVKLYVERKDSAVDRPITVDMAFVMPPTTAVDMTEETEMYDAARHPGVVCDGCDGAVVGYRYRCTSCRDYDLCQACEQAGTHSQHCMLRIPTPLPRFHIKSKIKRSRHMKPSHSEDHTAEKGDFAECPYFKKQRCEKSGERRHHQGGRRARGSWLDTVASYMNEFANLAGDVAGQAPTGPGSAPAPAGPQAATNAENGEATVPDPKTPPQMEAGPVPTNTPNETGEVPVLPQIQLDKLLNPENMKYVLEIQKTLAGILLPNLAGPTDDAASREQASAGSQTECRAGSHAATQAGSQAASHAATQASSAASSHASSQAGSEAGSHASSQAGSQVGSQISSQAISMDSTMDAPAKDRQTETPERVDGWTVINNDSDLIDVGVQSTAPQEPAQPIGFKDLPRAFTTQLNINDGSGLYPTLAASTGAGAAIPMPAPQRPTPVPQRPASIPQTAPTAPSTAAPAPILRLRHPKPHIEAAINQMMGMGFTNEGGWLTQLLESKDGNISAVLDLLTPVTVKRS